MKTEQRLLLAAAACALLAAPAPGCWMMMEIWTPEDGPDSETGTETETGTGTDTECDESAIPVYNDPAHVLILLDHSSSMEGTNWNVARAAINDLVSTFADGSVWFGLDTLPDPDGAYCGVSAPVAVDCGPGTEGAISDALAGLSTCVSTPLYAALEQLTGPEYAPGCLETDEARYVLLVADGEDSCSSPTAGEFAALTAELVEAGVRVIVVGFNVNMDSAQLEAIASNGGAGFDTYLNASDGPSLEAALDEVADAIGSCFFTLGSAAALAEPGLVNLYAGGDVVPLDEDCSSGWGWRWVDPEEGRIEFCADACALVEELGADGLAATFGCETAEG